MRRGCRLRRSRPAPPPSARLRLLLLPHTAARRRRDRAWPGVVAVNLRARAEATAAAGRQRGHSRRLRHWPSGTAILSAAMAFQVKLTYFDARALGEPIRYLLAYGDIAYEDVRLKFEQWPAIKPKMPFGKVPALEVDGQTSHQSVAICRYLAKRVGLAGGDAWEALQVDAAADTVADLRTAIVNYAFYSQEDEKPAKKDKLINETIPFYLTRMDKIVADNNGYFVNGKLSFADVLFAASVDFLSESMAMDLLDGRPNLKELTHKVNGIPKIQAWLDKRPKTQY